MWKLEVLVLLPAVCGLSLISVPQGSLLGHQLVSRYGRPFLAFQGIPYARPPLGELRFRAPEPPEPWLGVLNATRYAEKCIQRSVFAKAVNVEGSEDCLYLNVFRPLWSVGNGLDVMVWFHGGGFVSGAPHYYEPHHLLDHDVVLVTVAYRLGPLGFLSTGDESAPGNWGLKDQVAALQWVQSNIDKFGGNLGRVTLFGESAGGASVHLHMLSPLSRGLFHHAISQSGTALCAWALAPNGTTKHQAAKLAAILSCPVEPSNALVECLRTKSAQDIIATDKQFMEWDVDPIIPFKVVIEPGDLGEAFLPKHPLDLIREAPQDIPWLTGINSGDGGLKAAPIYEKPELVSELDRHFDLVAPISLLYKDTYPSDLAADFSRRIRQFYFQEKPIGNGTVHSVVDMYTDSFFLWAADEAVRLHLASSSRAPIYYYYFAYRGQHSFSELFGKPGTDFGVCHADELIYLFPSTRVFGNYTFSEEEDNMADMLLTMWVNFAHTGSPTSSWHPVELKEDLEYFHIASPHSAYMLHGLLTERARFWSSLQVYTSLHDEL